MRSDTIRQAIFYFQSKTSPGNWWFKVNWAVGGVITLSRNSLLIVLNTADLIQINWPFEISLYWLYVTMGSLQMQRADVLSFSRHAKERVSITDTSLKASSGEIFSSFDLLLIVKSIFSSSKSSRLRIPFSWNVLKWKDFPSIQINLLFHGIMFETRSSVGDVWMQT